MKKIVWGLIIGGVFGFLVGLNIGKNKPILSNPFEDKVFSEKIKDTAGDVIEKSREAIHEATKKEE
ncbi:MAG TPA: hypothetical protein ENI80_07350 [Acidiferrobacteraceae bacterium]|nr:hypothetical protein [Acidiferrobacteraceae bacterium]